ncbi:MAG: hypothetical protein IJV64_08510 [Oscillospiraceae bacterium]|nr:hypothetical protein [Oscillospiraceae bacterium]
MSARETLIVQLIENLTKAYCHDLNAAPAKLSLSKAYEMVYRNEALKTCSQWNTLSNRQIKALLSVPALSSEISLRIDGTKEQRRFFLGILSQIADDELSKVTQEKRQLRRKQLLKSVPPQL